MRGICGGLVGAKMNNTLGVRSPSTSGDIEKEVERRRPRAPGRPLLRSSRGPLLPPSHFAAAAIGASVLPPPPPLRFADSRRIPIGPSSSSLPIHSVCQFQFPLPCPSSEFRPRPPSLLYRSIGKLLDGTRLSSSSSFRGTPGQFRWSAPSSSLCKY